MGGCVSKEVAHYGVAHYETYGHGAHGSVDCAAHSGGFVGWSGIYDNSLTIALAAGPMQGGTVQ